MIPNGIYPQIARTFHPSGEQGPFQWRPRPGRRLPTSWIPMFRPKNRKIRPRSTCALSHQTGRYAVKPVGVHGGHNRLARHERALPQARGGREWRVGREEGTPHRSRTAEPDRGGNWRAGKGKCRPAACAVRDLCATARADCALSALRASARNFVMLSFLTDRRQRPRDSSRPGHRSVGRIRTGRLRSTTRPPVGTEWKL